MPIPSLADIRSRSHVDADSAQVTTTPGANGARNVTKIDAAGSIEGIDYNANGVATFVAWRNADDDSRGNATFDGQGRFVSAYIWEADGKLIQVAADGSYDETVESGGNSRTYYYTSGGRLTGESWDNANGSRGRKMFNADGSLQAAYEWDANGDLKQTSADGSYDLTQTRSDGRADTYYYDAQGSFTGHSWTTADGSYGRTFDNGDGTRTYYEFERNGNYTVLVADWYGNNDIEHYTADNRLYKTGYTREDGHRGGSNIEADGSFTSYDFKPDGSYLYSYGDANGNVTEQWYTADNQPFNPDQDQPGTAGTTTQADALVAAMAGFSAADDGAGASAGQPLAETELLLAGSAA